MPLCREIVLDIDSTDDPTHGQTAAPRSGTVCFWLRDDWESPARMDEERFFHGVRRLKQLVPEFDTFTLNQGQTLGMDPVLLAARLVGRWQSGAPIALTPAQDDSTMGPDPQRNNNFDFADDQAQRRCPFGAHIRKTNPRGDLVPQETGVDPHRIIRAGIPFGPEVSSAEETAGSTQQDRGLMFVCYQTSIPSQFEFVQSKWANNPGFVFGKKHPDGTPVTVGIDPITGQSNAPNRARTMDEPVSNYPTGNVRSTLTEPQDFCNSDRRALFLYAINRGAGERTLRLVREA
jgi:Dyp-type peroxidase family